MFNIFNRKLAGIVLAFTLCLTLVSCSQPQIIKSSNVGQNQKDFVKYELNESEIKEILPDFDVNNNSIMRCYKASRDLEFGIKIVTSSEDSWNEIDGDKIEIKKDGYLCITLEPKDEDEMLIKLTASYKNGYRTIEFSFEPKGKQSIVMQFEEEGFYVGNKAVPIMAYESTDSKTISSNQMDYIYENGAAEDVFTLLLLII